MTFATETAESCPLTEKQAAEQLAGMIERAGLDPTVDGLWPLDRETVSAVLTANEYSASVEELHRLGRMGHVPAIEQWDAKDLLCAVAALEARAQWQLTPSPLHDHKKHISRIGLESNLQAGPEACRKMLESLSGYDLPFCLQLMIGAEKRDDREKIATYIMALQLRDRGYCESPIPAEAGDQFNPHGDSDE